MHSIVVLPGYPCSRNLRTTRHFYAILGEALQKQPIRILAFILMPNHWHFLLWPKGDQELTNFCRWVTHTHSMRWHAHYHTSGTGHIYQGRFKSFAV